MTETPGDALVLRASVRSVEDATTLAGRIADEHPDRRFVVVLTTAHEPWLTVLADQLGPSASEWLFTDAVAGPPGAGAELAFRALSDHGLGQDAVFTVPVLSQAIRYAADQVSVTGPAGWEADAILVLEDPGTTGWSATGIAYDRAGPRGGPTVLLIHAGVADRRMWDPQWADLTQDHDVVRLDLRGFGDSTSRPPGTLSPVTDVLDSIAELGVARCHLVGASYGAGVAVEVALTRPELVASLFLSAPGGSLIAGLTDDLRSFVAAERAALAANDLDAAVEANLSWWVDGPHRDAGQGASSVREAVRTMQRRAFELTADWDDVEEDELDPPPFDRLAEITAPTLVLVGAHDLDAIHDAARRVIAGVSGAQLVTWPDVAHLPSLERSDDFGALLREWLDRPASPV